MKKNSTQKLKYSLIKNSSQKIKYSFINLLTGSDLSKRRLPLMEIKSVKSGPVVWLTACSHGDEIGGIVVIQEIFKMLRKMPLLKGSIHAFPLMNPIGFETSSRHITLSEEDLNRSFPGKKEGSLAERIADKIFNTIIKTNPTVLVDLHNDWTQTIPYGVIDPANAFRNKEVSEDVKSFAKQTGLILISEPNELIQEEDVSKSLSFSLIRKNIPAITLELGESFSVNETNVDIGVKSILRILSGLGMVNQKDYDFNFQMPVDIGGKILKYSEKPLSSRSGLVRFLVRPGDVVKKGDPLAKIYNTFGKIQEKIVAENDSIILGLSDTFVSFPGVPLISSGIISKNILIEPEKK